MENAAFIHCNLDDWGLKPHAFRVFCHIARRGKCFASVAKIASVCRINSDTARKALKDLVKQGLLKPEYRKGETTIYEVNHRNIVESPLPSKGSTPSDKSGVLPSQNKGGHPTEKKGGHPYEMRGDKVYPPKSIQLSKGNKGKSNMNNNVLLIELGKAIKALEKDCKEYRDRHRGEAAGGEYIWTPGGIGDSTPTTTVLTHYVRDAAGSRKDSEFTTVLISGDLA